MIEALDLSLSLPRDQYVVEISRRQIQLRELGWQVYRKKRPVIVVLEGWDAAGKGGVIKRLTAKLDPHSYIVYPISAPEGEEKTAIPLPFLAASAGTWPDRHFRSLLVRAGAGGTRGRIGRERRMEAGLKRSIA
jgi:Polyphosphate kinase 2 (PPK2)